MDLPRADLTKLVSGLFEKSKNIFEHRWLKVNNYGALHVEDSFKPSSYTDYFSATTNPVGQSIKITSGSGRVRINNLDATNYAKIVFGKSSAEVEANSINGTSLGAGKSTTDGIPTGATYMGFVGNTGTVILNITFGV